MYRIFTSLAAICCCLAFAQTSTAQITFSVVPTEQQANVQVGDTVTINMDVENFYNIASYQFTVGWDETAIDFESIHNLSLPGLSLGNFGAGPSATDNGFFTTLWPAPGGVAFSLFDGDTTIFSFDMIILNTAGITTPIEILMAPPNPPTGFEVIGEDENGMLQDFTGTSVVNNGTATELPVGNSPCDFATSFGQSMTSGSGDTGDEVCLTVSACGFTDIVSTQYSINFDPAIVQFLNTENYNLPGLNAGSFNGNNTSGFITFSWLDSLGTGTTVADETALYDICFTLIGAGGSSDNITFSNTPLTIEITDVNSMGAHIGFDSEPGTIDITGNSSSAVTVVASEIEGIENSEVCIQVTALNWDSIIAAQYSMHWDTSIIQFASLGNFGGELSSTDFNTGANFTDAGTLIFGYADDMLPADGSSVNNGDTLYEVCFNIVGDVGEESSFFFDGNPSIVEATQIINGLDQTVPLLTQDGSATVIPGVGTELVLDIQETVICSSGDTCVDVVASNFVSYGWQFTIDYDPAILDYTGFSSGPSQIASGLQMNETSDGNIVSIWVGNGTENITFLTDTVVFSLCFNAVGDDLESSTIVFDQSSAIEIIDLDGLIPSTLIDGSITIDDSSNGCSPGPPTPTADITHVACFGDDTGAIEINNTAPGYTYVWSPPNGETATSISGLIAGTYNVTVTDTNNGSTNDASFTVNEPAAALSLSLAKTDALCENGANGTATATVTGGTVAGMYTYLWDNDDETTATITGLSAGEVCVTVTDDNGCTTDACIMVGEGTPIEIDFTVTNSACDVNTGIITAVATGGSGTFDVYSWSGGQNTAMITDLAPGNYCLTVTDSNGCKGEECVDVGTLDGPTGSIASTTPTTCSTTADGSITASATGGTGPPTYFWGPGETGPTYSPVPAGMYSCTITDAAGCSTVVTGEVMAGPGISVSIANSETDCSDSSDGTLTANVSNGSGIYTYAWTPDVGSTAMVTDLAPGAYTVTVTDTNGCSDVETGMVMTPSPVEADASVTSDYNGEDISCFGGSDGSVTVDPSGGAGGNDDDYTYLWHTGATTQDVSGLGAGECFVTVTDANGCSTITSVILTQPDPLTLVLSATDEVAGGDGAVESTVGGGESPYEYLWSPGGATAPNITGLNAGEYCLTVTDENGCTISACATVNGLNSLDVSLLSMTPESCFGESDGLLAVTHNGDDPWEYAWDIGGTIINTTIAQITGLSAGTYSVTVTDNNGTSGVESGLVVGGPSQDITYTVSKTDVNCNGDATGSITLDISGGNGAPYAVAWNSGGPGVMITDLSADSYTPTITDNNGCTKVGTPIDITEPTSMAITLDGTVNAGCNGEATGEIHVSVTGGTGLYSYEWFPGGIITTTGDLTMLSAGSYSVIVTDANNCQATTGQITVDAAGSPEITIVSQMDVTCAGDADGSIDIFISGGSGNPQFEWGPNGEDTEDLSNLSGGTYFVTVTDVSGCTDVAGPIVIAEPTPIILSVASITPATSAGDDGEIEMNEPTGGTGPGTYTYEWGHDNTITTKDISGLEAGTYILTVTDLNGCTESIDIIVSGTFAVASADITHVSCAGAADGAIDITMFGGVLCPGATDFEYIWDTEPNGTISQDLTNLEAGTYCVTVTDCGGLTATDCFVVDSVDLLQISNFNVTNETGDGCNGSIEITVDGGNAPYDFLWSNGADPQNLSMLCKGNYTVTITDVNGCMLISPPIEVLPTPMSVVNVSTTETDCAGEPFGSEACISVFGGCGPYDFTIGANTQSSTDGQGVCFDDLPAGTYMLTISDSDGSTNTPDIIETITISEPAPIIITLESTSNNTGGIDCNGTINITATGGTVTGSHTYEWSHGPSSPDVDMLCNDNSPYSVTVSDDNGCTSVFDNIIINDVPFITADVDNITCFGSCDGSIALSVAPGTGPYSYMWSTGETSFIITDLCPDDSPFTVTVTDAIGITSVESFTIFGPASPLSVTTVDSIPALGDSPTGSIDIDPTGGWGGYSFMWSNGATSEDIGGLLGDEYYTVTVTDMGGCQFIHTVYVGKVEIKISSSEIEDEDCNGNENGFICIETIGGVLPHSYAWNVDGVGDEPCVYGIGAGTFIVTVTDATGGLSETFEFTMTEKEELVVDITITPGTAAALGSGGTPEYTYQWNDDAMTIGSVLEAPTGKYQVVVTDENNCTVVGEAIITEELGGDCAEVRTILTPNGDNSNETFEVLCARVIDVDLEIFNRWGQKVYETTNYGNDWRGTDNDGNPLPEDGYFYVLQFADPEDGSDRQVKGYVTIVREE